MRRMDGADGKCLEGPEVEVLLYVLSLNLPHASPPLCSLVAPRCFCSCTKIISKDDSNSFGQKVRYFSGSLIS